MSVLVTVALLQREDTIIPNFSLGGTTAGSWAIAVPVPVSLPSCATAYPSSGTFPDPTKNQLLCLTLAIFVSYL